MYSTKELSRFVGAYILVGASHGFLTLRVKEVSLTSSSMSPVRALTVTVKSLKLSNGSELSGAMLPLYS